MAKKDYRVYKLKDGNRIVYIGITNNPSRRTLEHINAGKEFNGIDFLRGTFTRKKAEEEEYIEIMAYQNSHRGNPPKYNTQKTAIYKNI